MSFNLILLYFKEFLAATIDTNTYLKEERLYEAFKIFDKVRINFNMKRIAVER